MRACLQCDHTSVAENWTCVDCGWAPQRSGSVIAFAPELADKSEGFDAAFFERIARSEPGHWWFEARNAVIFWALDRFFPDATSFLEVGCGTGFVLGGIAQHRPPMRTFGSEIFIQGVRVAQKRRPEATLFQMDARAIPFRDEFDVVGAFDVIEHIADDRAALRGIARAVRPGGGVLLTVPQHPWLWSKVDTFSHHERRYRQTELRDRIAGAGLKITYVTSFVSLLLPAMLAARVRQKDDGSVYDPETEFRISAPLNSALRAIMRAELAAIRAGVRFPVGGSLLAVCRRG